jgi:hypothetical protein
MFDNLRDLSDTPLYEDDQKQDDLFKDIDEVESSVAAPVSKRKSGTFLGMTAQQRFLISVMLMFTVLLLGTLAMFVLGRMSIF